MVSLGHETYIPLTEVPHHVASRPSVRTVRRWARQGVRDVKLRTWLCGGRRFTDRPAIDEFLRAVNENSDGTQR
jgi:hypothetical protein